MPPKKPENPQAFPVSHHDYVDPIWGMTLRDYFAGQALTGLLAGNLTRGNLQDLSCQERAAYRLADAMLAEREKEA